MKHLYGLILAGGSGTRLWPISREYYPKQFLQLFGNQTLIQQTFQRLAKVVDPKNIYISTNRIFINEIVIQLEKFGLEKNNIIIQPTDKNTAPAIGQATKRICENDSEAIVITTPADLIMDEDEKFAKAFTAASELAKKDLLVIFGVTPTEKNSQLGYIAVDKKMTERVGHTDSFKVKKFIEKPTLENSAKLIKNGCLWNSGMFVWKAKTILQEIKRLQPTLYKGLDDRQKYFTLIPEQIDTSIMEKSQNVWVIPVNFVWKDIGSWTSLYELLPKDAQGNVSNDHGVSYKSKNSLIYGIEGKTLTVVGVKDLIIVQTKDSVLVAEKNGLAEMKEALKFMQEKQQQQETKNRPLVSIITATHNDKEFIETAMQSVYSQQYKNIEYIVIEGNSTDGTKKIIERYRYKIEQYISLPNTSYFEKINKGLSLANGDIIGILGPEDNYHDESVIDTVVTLMEKEKADLCWGDLIYFDSKDAKKISMYWKSSDYKKGHFQKGWMPPFPTLFAKKSVYNKFGAFAAKYRVAAEYELMLRLLERHEVKGNYIPRILVDMTGRGISVQNIIDRIVGNIETYRAWKKNELPIHPLFLLSKNLGKLPQIFGEKPQ